MKLPSQLLQKIELADVVSFDVFDTLLDRPLLRPTDVFTVARERVNESREAHLEQSWTTVRIEAEQACYQNPAVGPDISLHDIYTEIGLRSRLPQGILDIAMRAEIDAEVQMLRATERGRAAFFAAVQAGKRIVIVSDMYLPPHAISDALRKQQLDTWDRLIVSGHDKVGKHSGTAYAFLLTEYPDQRILHIGDNRSSDFSIPLSLGIDAYHLSTPLESAHIRGSALALEPLARVKENPNHTVLEFNRSLTGGLIQRWLDRQDRPTPAQEIGFSVLGPMLVGFSQWLHQTALDHRTRRLAFLSREGALLKRAYEHLWGPEAVDSTYVYASRRMMNLTSIDSFGSQELDFLCASGAPLRAEDYVRRFVPAIPRGTVAQAASQVGISPREFLEPKDSARLRALFLKLEHEILALTKAERSVVVEYLREEGLSHPDTAVVDVGWQGSIQGALRKLMNNPELGGYYFGIHPTAKTQGRSEMHGYVDGRLPGSQGEWQRHCLLPGVEVVELMFANPLEPSILTVSRVDGEFVPVYSAERVSDRDSVVITQMQESALDFVRGYRDLRDTLPVVLWPQPLDSSLTLLGELVMKPTAAQAAALGGLLHDNSLGVRSSPLAMPSRSRRHYWWNPLRHQRDFDRAWWKAGFEANVSSNTFDHFPRS